MEDIITLSTADGVIAVPADGVSRLDFTAQLGPLADGNSLISFTTEQGSFAQATGTNPTAFQVKATGKTALATLITSTVESPGVLVSAKVGDFLVSREVSFTRAYPTDMTVNADKFTIDADGSDAAEITVNLVRELGLPSDGAKIFFEVVELDSAEAIVPDFVFTTGTQAQADLVNTNNTPGKVRLVVTTRQESGPDLVRELEFTFVD